jgi:hypothetical protein
MTCALGLLALLYPVSARFVGVAIAFAGAAMFGVTTYAIVTLPEPPSVLALFQLGLEASATPALYFAAVTSALIGLAGAIMAAVGDEYESTEITEDGALQW